MTDIDFSKIKLDSLSDHNNTLRSNLSQAITVNPDSYAENQRLALESGLPVSAVENNPEEVRTNLRFNQIDLDKLETEFPTTSNFLSNYDNAVIAQDDIGVLETLERIFGDWGERTKLNWRERFHGVEFKALDNLPDEVDQLIPATALPLGFPDRERQRMSIDMAEQMGIRNNEDLQSAKDAEIERLVGEVKGIQERRQELTPEDLTLLESGARAGLDSLTDMAPGMAMMLLTGGRAWMLAPMGIQTGFSSYADARADGLNPNMAAWYGSLDAAIEVGTELMPTGTLQKMLTGDSTGKLGREAIKFLIQEMGTEQIATIGQSLNALAFGLDEELEQAIGDAGEISRIMTERMATTAVATMFAGGAQAGIVGGVSKLREMNRDRQMEQLPPVVRDNVTIGQVNQLAGDSALRQRSPEVFSDFIEKLATKGNETVFIDAAQLSLYLEGQTEGQTTDPVVMLLTERLQQAAGSGEDVTLPIKDYAAVVAGTPHAEALQDSMSLSQDTNSMFRQQQVEAETENFINSIIEEAEGNLEMYQQAQNIYLQVREQLVDTGQVSPQAASTMAQLVPAWATLYAERNGTTIEEAFSQTGLRIEGPQTGERQRLESELSELAQGQVPTDETVEQQLPADIQQAIEAPTLEGPVTPGGIESSELINAVNSNGGVTLNQQGMPIEPDAGFTVSIRSFNVQNVEQIPALMSAMLNNVQGLNRPELVVGAFKGEKVTSVDTNVVVATQEEAEALAVEFDQEAIWDNAAMQAIETGGTGQGATDQKFQQYLQRPQVADTDGRDADGTLISPPVSNGVITLDHFSRVEGLQFLDPEKYGTGIRGEERTRDRDEFFVNRTVHGIAVGEDGGYKKERALGSVHYRSQIPASSLYDAKTDPDGFKENRQEARNPRERLNLLEKRIKDAGYLGYWNNHPSHGMVAVTFSPLKTTPVSGKVLSQPPVFEHSAKNQTEFIKHLSDLVLEQQGRLLDENTPENNRIIANQIASEIIEELGEDSAAADWYKDSIESAIDYAALIHPELKTDKLARKKFIMILAITSNGSTVKLNAENTNNIYTAYKESGVLSIENGRSWGTRGKNIQGAFDKLAGLMENLGEAEAFEFFETEFTAKELTQMGFTVSGENTTTVVPGSSIFGPKIGGGFYQNLIGNWQYVTMDQWFMKTWGRITGTGYNSKKNELVSAPTNGKQRVWIREVLAEAQANLAERGYDIDIAAIQALLWYREKDIYLANGVADTKAEATDYEQEFHKIAEEQLTDTTSAARRGYSTAGTRLTARERAELRINKKTFAQGKTTEQRLADAEALGFDTSTVYYRGTSGLEVESGELGRPDSPGVWISSNIDYVQENFPDNKASLFHGVGVSTVTLFLKGTPFDLREHPELMNEFIQKIENYEWIQVRKYAARLKINKGLPPFSLSSELLKFLDDKGVTYDSVKFDEFTTDNGPIVESILVTNRDSLRSTNAQFDKDAGSNLLAQSDRGYFDAENTVIRLTEASDLSTFIHEFAHFMYEMERRNNGNMLPEIDAWFRRNAQSLAVEAKVSEEDVLNWLNGETNDAVEVAAHEQFARGFERYLMEGQSPSVELHGVFRTIARWMQRIYGTIKNSLKVNLDNEMREVFDRMLATEEQINAAKVRAQASPMFETPQDAGMTEKQFEEYTALATNAEDTAHEQLRNKLIEQLKRKAAKEWNQEKADLTEQILGQLEQLPVYRAINQLKSGEIKLDRNAVKQSVGQDSTTKTGESYKRMPPQFNGLTKTGGEGIHPDEAAVLLGYPSGQQLLTDIAMSDPIKKVAKERAEQRMIEIHGDILNDGTIEQEADAAMQNEERARLLVKELRALSKGTSIPKIDRQMIKEMAYRKIGKLSYSEIHPYKYRRAEINAAQESAKAHASGDNETAAREKMRQVLNFYLAKAASDAREETDKIVRRMARYGKKDVVTQIMKAENGYWEQIQKILNRFEFRKSARQKQVDVKNEAIASWMSERMATDGDQLVISPAVLDETYSMHWKRVPHNELVGVYETIKNIEHVARYSNKMTMMQEEIDFKNLVDRWTGHMDKANTTKFKTQRTTVTEGRNLGRLALAQMSKVPWLASWLDGGERVGMTHEVLVDPFNVALQNEYKLWNQSAKPVIDAINKRSKADIKRHNSTIHIPEIVTEENDGNLKGNQILAVALNTGNAGNLRKMLLGEGWASPDNDAEIVFENPKLQAVLKHMSKSDWDLVQLIWNQMDTLYPLLSEVHRRTTGLTPPKVEATPIVTTAGEYRGGYYPVKYDSNRSENAQMNEERLSANVDSMFSTNGSIHASVNAGATNERTGFYDPIRLSLDVVPNHFQETIHFITHHDAVRQANKLLRNRKVQKTITEKLGKEEFAQLRPWLNDIAKDGRESNNKSFIDNILNRLRFGVTLGVMGFKASTGIIQVSGLSNSAAEVGVGNLVKGMKMILASEQTIQEAVEFAYTNSRVFENRVQTMDREMRSAMEALEGKDSFSSAVQETSMKHIAYIQLYSVDLPTWYAAYSKELQDSGDEQKAFRYADWVIENVQGSGATKDMPTFMRNQSGTHRAFTMFMTFFSSLWNAQRDTARGARGGQYSVTTVAAKTAFMITLPVLFEMIMRGEFWDDEEDEVDVQRILTNTALFPVQGVPFIRDVASGVIGDFGYNMSPISSVIERGAQGYRAIAEGTLTDKEITSNQMEGAVKLTGAFLGVPGVNQVWSTSEHLYEVLENGEDLTAREFLFGPDRD